VADHRHQSLAALWNEFESGILAGVLLLFARTGQSVHFRVFTPIYRTKRAPPYLVFG
jgi:hypothetical protein